jgi:hypothetical protein
MDITRTQKQVLELLASDPMIRLSKNIMWTKPLIHRSGGFYFESEFIRHIANSTLDRLLELGLIEYNGDIYRREYWITQKALDLIGIDVYDFLSRCYLCGGTGSFDHPHLGRRFDCDHLEVSRHLIVSPNTI